MKLTDSELYKQVVQRLRTEYADDGRAALERFTSTERHVLYAETTLALNETSKHLAKFAHDQVSQHKKQLLETQIADIAGFMKSESEREWRERGPNEPEMER